MAYCKLGEKATVNYSFRGANKSYVTTKTPIEVDTYTKRVNAGGTFNAGGFGVKFYSPNNRVTTTRPCHDYIIFPSDSARFYPGENYAGISFWDCGNFDFNRLPDGSLNGPGINTATLEILPNLFCTSPLTENKCSIEVKHNGIIIFQDQGECPVSFEVVCGENCPPGTVKCRKSGYPGYCCLPCQPTKQSIINIKNIVKNVNQEPVSRG